MSEVQNQSQAACAAEPGPAAELVALIAGDDWEGAIAATARVAEDCFGPWMAEEPLAGEMATAVETWVARQFRATWGDEGAAEVGGIWRRAELLKIVGPAPWVPKGAPSAAEQWVARLEAIADVAEWVTAALAVVRSGEATVDEVAREAVRQWGYPEAGDEFREVWAAEGNARAEDKAETAAETTAEIVAAAEANLTQEEKAYGVGTAVAVRPVFIPEAVKEMNDKHAVISNLGGKCVVMEWARSAITPGAEELAYQSFASFRERYGNRYVDFSDGRGRTESVPRAPYWLAHPQRRQYEGLDLVPNGPAVLPGGYLNLWRGWGVPPRRGSWRLMQRHIAEVLADGDQKFEDFIRRWTAWKFQNPGLRAEVVLALLGGKGAGKGAWGYAQMLIWGQHGLQIFSSDHLCGKHNAHLQNKLFLFLDEAMWAGDRDAERVLKGITTEKWMMIEPKGINAFQWPNRLGILMSGNDKWIVPASHDERRYAVNKISEKWKQNKDYFRPLFAEIENGGAAAMLYDLLQLDLDGWRPSENVPQTRALVEQKMLGLTGLEQWYAHLLGVGELPRPSTKNPRWVLSGNLMDDAKAHNPRNKFTTADELGRFMREMGCEHKSNGKAWGWVFPPLVEAREAWRTRAGGTWEWLAPEIEDWGQKPHGGRAY